LWSTLADLTGWFNWDALAAIGTVGALWFAVVQSSRTGRAERAKAEGILTFLIGLIEPVEDVPIYENTDERQLRNTPRDEIEQGLAIVRRALAGLASLDRHEVSSVGAVEWTMALPLALHNIEHALDTCSMPLASSVQSSLLYTQEAVAHFRKQRERLRYGPLARWVRNAWLKRNLRRSERRVRRYTREVEAERSDR
jgi:hypothetical protein